MQSAQIAIPPALFDSNKIIEAAKYPGPNFEEKLKRLLKVDLYYAQALYYLNQEQAGFMAQERFERAHDRAIADIREASKIKEDDARMKAALNARSSWLEGFRRARFRDKPVR
jgi:ribosome modulation factor